MPDPIWQSIVAGTIGLVGVMAGVWLTQRQSEKRERRNRRDEVLLDLYLDVIKLVVDNEEALALARGRDTGETPPIDLGKKRVDIYHRLRLIASKPVQEAYINYKKLVFEETELGVQHRPPNPGAVSDMRDLLIQRMAEDIQKNA